jgi:hypothetical protein
MIKVNKDSNTLHIAEKLFGFNKREVHKVSIWDGVQGWVRSLQTDIAVVNLPQDK